MNIFNEIYVPQEQMQYCIELSSQERTLYLCEIYESELLKHNSSSVNLDEFFESFNETLSDQKTLELTQQGDNHKDHVDVLIDNEIIMIESNSLKALRYIRNQFIESGYILQRDMKTEKLFRVDKITRYLRVFRIITIGPALCVN